MNEMSLDRVRRFLHYDEATGVLSWKVNRGKARVGRNAGCEDGDGYIQVLIDRKRFLAHRLCWAISHDAWPILHIDHLNGDRKDNRLCNLRQVPIYGNNQNRHMRPSHSKSPYLGVFMERGRNRWRARIQVDGRKRSVGTFATAEDAHAAYLAAKATLHPYQTIAKVAPEALTEDGNG
jgi:hypothetical protein